MAVHLASHHRGLAELVRLESYVFAAKLHLARAVLGWSQSELGRRIDLTQRAIHKLEQGTRSHTGQRCRRSKKSGASTDIKFEDLTAGGFRISIPSSALSRPEQSRRQCRRGTHN
jgi:transcriptional regulator with XRE-family HTH domain